MSVESSPDRTTARHLAGIDQYSKLMGGFEDSLPGAAAGGKFLLGGWWVKSMRSLPNRTNRT